MPNFLDLSKEIRIMIYEYCLVKNYPFVPYNKEYYPMNDRSSELRKDPPTLVLLRVSKSIEAEAAPILYGKNVWRITVHAPLMEISTLNGIQYNNLWERRGDLIKHIVLVFDQRDINVTDYVSTTRQYHLSRVAYSEGPTNWNMHDGAQENMCSGWNLKFSHVEKLPNLRSIELNVDNLFCYIGCCRERVLEVLLEELEWRFATKSVPPNLWKPDLKITVRGIRGDRERTIMRSPDFPLTILEEVFIDPKEFTYFL